MDKSQSSTTHTRLIYYQAAVYITLTLAAIDLAFTLYLRFRGPGYIEGIIVHTAIASAVVFGLWVQSNLARYLGGAWFVVSVLSAIWPLFSSDKFIWNVGVIWVVLMGLLSLASAYLLLASKQFALEFRKVREARPAYKTFLTKVFVVVAIAAALIATFSDILKLASSP